MILKDPQVPTAIKKLFDKIDGVHSCLTGETITVGRKSQSCNYYGFYAKAGSTTFWFGYFLAAWERLGCPVLLQLKEEWIKDELKGALKSQLDKLGFSEDKDHGYLRPFAVDSMDRWSDELQQLLTELAAIE